ncbi:MAG TPA: hypothetical protein VED41_11710 [Solirubrobacteraceae bacterium]|nr:hypothetical protein [Solirubrobacteraceae bacterium]
MGERNVATVDEVPKRTNLFQEVVAIIHEHMAGEADVEESGFLPHRVTGAMREVDVVIRSRVAGHEVIICAEATSTGRKASVEWVERMVKKHSDLATSRLVLVSDAGFTTDARKQAEHDQAVALSPEDLTGPDPAFVVVSKLASLWLKTIELKPEVAEVVVRRPDGAATLVHDLQPDHVLYFDNGQPAAMLRDAFSSLYGANFPSLAGAMGLEDIAEDTECPFVSHWGPPCTVEVNGEPKHLALRWEASEPHELHQILEVERVVRRWFEFPTSRSTTRSWATSPTPSARGPSGSARPCSWSPRMPAVRRLRSG